MDINQMEDRLSHKDRMLDIYVAEYNHYYREYIKLKYHPYKNLWNYVCNQVKRMVQ